MLPSQTSQFHGAPNDGKKIEGILTCNCAMGERNPLVLQIHGGPEVNLMVGIQNSTTCSIISG